jgi:hypothetical protein
MSEFEINWLVNINDEKSRLNVTGSPLFPYGNIIIFIAI